MFEGTRIRRGRDVRIKNGVTAKEMSRQKVSKETILTARGFKVEV